MIRGQRVRRVIRHIDTWSVLRVAVLFYLSLMLVIVLAGVMLWVAGSVFGAVDGMESFMAGIGFEGFEFVGGQLLRAFTALGLVLVVLGTGATVLAAVLYNLIADVVGGVQLSVLEEVHVPEEGRADVVVDADGAAWLAPPAEPPLEVEPAPAAEPVAVGETAPPVAPETVAPETVAPEPVAPEPAEPVRQPVTAVEEGPDEDPPRHETPSAEAPTEAAPTERSEPETPNPRTNGWTTPAWSPSSPSSRPADSNAHSNPTATSTSVGGPTGTAGDEADAADRATENP